MTLPSHRAPDFTHPHLIGHPVTLRDFPHRPVVILFGGRSSWPQAQQIAAAIRARYRPEDLLVVSVFQLVGVPRLIRGLVQAQMRKVYEDAVRVETATRTTIGQALPADASEVVVMLLDWEGMVARRFRLSDIDHTAVGVLVDANGMVLGEGRGVAGGDTLIALAAARGIV